MPYRRRSTKTTRKRRPRNATAKVVKTARYKKSARAQSKQIRVLGRATARLQSQIRDDHNADLMYAIDWSNRKCTTTNTSTKGNVVILPLSSGPTANDPTNGAVSNLPFLNADPTIRDMAWEAVQPKSRTVQDGRGGPSWCRIFRQSTRMCFHSNNLTSQVRYTLFVIRIARPEDGSDLDNTMLQRMNQIDGVTGLGHPSAGTDFARGEDYYSINGFLNPLGQTNTTQSGVDIPQGHLCVRMNPQRWKVVHKREFVLGPARGNNDPQTSQVSQSHVQAGDVTPNNTTFYSTSFSINYGGALIKPNNIDSATTPTDPISLNDYAYADLNPRFKYYVALFPSKHVQETDPTGVGVYQQGCPMVSLQSTISCKVPA